MCWFPAPQIAAQITFSKFAEREQDVASSCAISEAHSSHGMHEKYGRGSRNSIIRLREWKWHPGSEQDSLLTQANSRSGRCQS